MNQFAMRNSVDELIDEIDTHFGWLPTDENIDVSSAHWYKYGGGRKAGREAKLVRKIKRELSRLSVYDNGDST